MGELLKWPKQEPKENPTPYTTVNVLADAFAAYNQIARAEQQEKVKT